MRHAFLVQLFSILFDRWTNYEYYRDKLVNVVTITCTINFIYLSIIKSCSEQRVILYT